eukprot:CAMPEP_0194770132 /NCGR_PEP_ID=MMETSP0323_2-20130528/45295_1 /TAXON_ID=2866 ORGANISM="Crypthecodinium cohnii, Strain Seligo" /NCGR_SAMPLE_ID=MMETSP0323_2 /ASSEMBLY_ACC=CAM_ASM_000346 /LENGTH=47 /DNA_ID= /DNA_START= /DNA_END= /DNA_ORIENTATION=
MANNETERASFHKSEIAALGSETKRTNCASCEGCETAWTDAAIRAAF